jgi:hypothetical protein
MLLLTETLVEIEALPCIAGDATSPSTSIDLTRDEGERTHCFKATCRRGLGGWTFHELGAGREYFALMFTPTDSSSIILMSDVVRTMDRPTPASPPLGGTSARRTVMAKRSTQNSLRSADFNPQPSSTNGQVQPSAAADRSDSGTNQTWNNDLSVSRASSSEEEDSASKSQDAITSTERSSPSPMLGASYSKWCANLSAESDGLM